MEKVYQQNWIDLPRDVRARLAQVFGLERTGITEVRDQTVVSDGYTNGDLQGITLDKMNQYIGSVETFPRAWEITLMKVKYELHPPTVEIGVGEVKEEKLEELKEEVKDESIKEKKKSK